MADAAVEFFGRYIYYWRQGTERPRSAPAPNSAPHRQLGEIEWKCIERNRIGGQRRKLMSLIIDELTFQRSLMSFPVLFRRVRVESLGSPSSSRDPRGVRAGLEYECVMFRVTVVCCRLPVACRPLYLCARISCALLRGGADNPIQCTFPEEAKFRSNCMHVHSWPTCVTDGRQECISRSAQEFACSRLMATDRPSAGSAGPVCRNMWARVQTDAADTRVPAAATSPRARYPDGLATFEGAAFQPDQRGQQTGATRAAGTLGSIGSLFWRIRPVSLVAVSLCTFHFSPLAELAIRADLERIIWAPCASDGGRLFGANSAHRACGDID